MVKIRERFHKIAFLVTRILSLVISLAWLGFGLYVLYEEFGRFNGLSTLSPRKIEAIVLIGCLIGIPCLIQMFLSIFIQQRKKWAIASMFVYTAIEEGIAITVFIASFDNPNIPFIIFCFFLITILGVYIYVLAESYIAINLEKISRKGFEVLNASGVIQVSADSTGQPIDKTE